MRKNSVRVIIPTSVEGLLNLSGKIYNKFQEDGDKSEIYTLEDYNWKVIGPNVALAQKKHEEAEALKGKMEQAYRERDNYMGDIDAVVRASKNLLLPVFKKNPKKLCDYGYTVDDTPKPKKKDVVKMEVKEQKAV